MRKTGVSYDGRMLLHVDRLEEHPESPLRLTTIIQKLNETELSPRLTFIDPFSSPEDEEVLLSLAHPKSHIRALKEACENVYSDMEDELEMDSLYLCRDSVTAAQVAANCTVALADAIGRGEVDNGFAIVRPPGHHAEGNKAMGFCLFNNVAIASRYLIQKQLAKKIMIIDWDIHYGNGTAEILEGDPNILFISLHRYDNGTFYPIVPQASPTFVGEGDAKGKSINIAWNGSGINDTDYLNAFSRIINPVATEFNPDFVIVSAGFDASEGDPIGGCLVTPTGFAQMTHRLKEFAGGKILLVLEGGYDTDMISNCAESCIKALLGDPIPHSPQSTPSSPTKAGLEAIELAVRVHSPFWKNLYPKYYQPSTESVPLYDAISAHWMYLCRKQFQLIPMPLDADRINPAFKGNVHMTDPQLRRKDSSNIILVIAHESGSIRALDMKTNIINANNTTLHHPFASFIEEALRKDFFIVDLCIPAKSWRLKQTQTGYPKELAALLDIFKEIWDNIIQTFPNDSQIFFISSGLPSYSICSLSDHRDFKNNVNGVIVISPTLFLPVSSPEQTEWYSGSSMVLVPTSREAGSHIPTNPSFGRCISSGIEDPHEISSTIENFKDRIFTFIESKLKQ